MEVPKNISATYLFLNIHNNMFYRDFLEHPFWNEILNAVLVIGWEVELIYFC
jgi:hypothetical protein